MLAKGVLGSHWLLLLTHTYVLLMNILNMWFNKKVLQMMTIEMSQLIKTDLISVECNHFTEIKSALNDCDIFNYKVMIWRLCLYG